ncbi:MAG: SprB repeat-containing protein [Crocinitomicaceae bacterium]
MKRLLFAITLLTSLNQLNSQSWHNVGPIGTPVATNVTESEFIIAADGTPYVFYVSSDTQKGSVKKWDGSSWINFGPANFTETLPYNIRLESYGSSVFVSYYWFDSGNDFIKVHEVTASGTVDMSSYIGQGVILTNSNDPYDFNVSPSGEVQLAFFENYWENSFLFCVWNGSHFNDPYNYLPGNTQNAIQIETDMFGNDWVSVCTGSQIELLKRSGNTWTNQINAFQGGTYTKIDLSYNYEFGASDVRVNTFCTHQNQHDLKLTQYENATMNYQNSGVISSNIEYFDIASDSNRTFIFASEGTSGGNYYLGYYDHITDGFSPILNPFLPEYTYTEVELKQNGEPVVSYIDASGSLWVIESWQNVSFTCQNLSTCGGNTETFTNVINLTSENLDNNDLTWGIATSNTTIVPVASVVAGSYPDYDILLTTNKVYNANLPVTLTISVEDELGIGNQTSNHNLSVKYVDSLINYFTSTSVCSNVGPIDFNDYVYPLGGNFTGIPSTGIVNPATSGNPVTFSYSTVSAVGCYNQMNIGFGISAAPSATVNVTNAGCSDSTGTAIVSATGGSSPYTYYWNTGADSVNLADLPAGQYFVTVTDNNGCMATGVGNVGNTSINLMASANGVSCPGDNNGSIDLTIAGVGPYDILWSNGYWTEDITGLEPGFYDVTVTDANGCEVTGTYEVSGPNEFTVSESNTASTCGASTGAITLLVSGGTGTLDYQWYDSGSNAIGTNSNSISNIGGGSYSVEISDANGCTYNYSTTVSEAGAPTVTVDQVVKATCANDGAINITITGTPTSINWSNGATTEDISGLAPGTYTVTVLDAGGCQSIKNVTVNPQLPATPQICVVTVDSITTSNVVVWEKVVTSNISHYNIYREGSQAGQYLKIDSVLYSEDSEFNDLVASPMVRSWRYKISAVDNCGNESAKSAYHKTIHATINLGLGSNINILWDSYEGLSYSSWSCWRYTTTNGFELIWTNSSNVFSYTDTPPSTQGLIM